MSIKLEINNSQLEGKLSVHYLPASIEGDGEAKVDEYFNNYTTKENGVLTNALRGYPLEGTEFKVPQDYVGVALQETNKTLDTSSDRLIRVTGTFDDFTYWNYDKVPTEADALRQAVQLITVANQISKPVSEDEIENEIKKSKV